MPVSDALKPCPFCGAPMASYAWREQAGTVVVECRFCGVRTNSGETETEVAELWNRRAALDAQGTPEGYQIVPIKPTNNMLLRCQTMQAAAGYTPNDAEWLREIWSSMLKALPAPPEGR